MIRATEMESGSGSGSGATTPDKSEQPDKAGQGGKAGQAKQGVYVMRPGATKPDTVAPSQSPSRIR